jgi:2-iminobutanoate/2-iminopropanoate deaminase
MEMAKRCIISENGPPAAGPYSHAVAIPGTAQSGGELLFLSGQGPFALDGSGALRGTLEEETRHTLDNLKTVLADCGSSLEEVLKVTVYLADMGNFAAFNAIYQEYFVENCPARTCIQAGRLPMDIQVEVDAIALVAHHK